MRGLVRLVRRRIATKLTLTLVGFVAVALLAGGLYLRQALEALAVRSLESRLAAAARLLHDEARDRLRQGDDPAEIHALVTGAARSAEVRVTLIRPDGRVVGESEVPLADLGRLANHGDRPEVRAALGGRLGRDVRTSATFGAPLLYVALPIEDRGRILGALRLAVPLATVTASYRAIHRVLLGGALVALAVAFGIGLFVASRVTRPVVQMQTIARRMSEGDFSARAPVRSPDEIGQLGRALNVMAARLRERLDELTREQGKVAAILDAMVEGVIAVDGRDEILLINERARAMFGLGAMRAEGKPFLEVIRNADLHQVFRAGRTEGAGAVWRRELRLAGPVERRLQVNAVPLRLAGGEVGVVMVLHDITELRRLEQVRTEFVANVSHELRTPLTAIRGYLETLLGGAVEDPEQRRSFLEVVARHTERLGRLLDDLTDLSNIELGRIALDIQPVRLAEVVESVLAILRPRAEQGGLALATDLDASAPSVEADRDRLAQILINLVDNAVKYTPPGGRVTVASRAAADGKAEISVRDTGIGIPPADLPRITERFYRVDRARSRELGGTGLGLAIVKHLVIAHGGELHIESEPGRGTDVRFTLRQAR